MSKYEYLLDRFSNIFYDWLLPRLLHFWILRKYFSQFSNIYSSVSIGKRHPQNLQRSSAHESWFLVEIRVEISSNFFLILSTYHLPLSPKTKQLLGYLGLIFYPFLAWMIVKFSNELGSFLNIQPPLLIWRRSMKRAVLKNFTAPKVSLNF